MNIWRQKDSVGGTINVSEITKDLFIIPIFKNAVVMITDEVILLGDDTDTI